MQSPQQVFDRWWGEFLAKYPEMGTAEVRQKAAELVGAMPAAREGEPATPKCHPSELVPRVLGQNW